LRAQLLAEPVRDRSLVLLRRCTDLALRVSSEVPNSPAMRRTVAAEGMIQRLDRPTRGLITVPSTPLKSLRASMALPPAAHP
jgi:hypothetical protein